jgi:hypothetical protein
VSYQGGRLNEGDLGEGIWLMYLIVFYKIEKKRKLLQFLLSGNNVTNVKYKPNRNCHYESSLYNEYIPRNNMRSICNNYREPNWSGGLAAVLEQLHTMHTTLVQIPLPIKTKEK